MIDFYFSSVLMQIALFILLTILVATLFYVAPVSDAVDSLLKKMNFFRFRKIIVGLAFAVMLVPLLLPVLNAQYWGFGFAKAFKEAGRTGRYIYAIDEGAFGGGKFGPARRHLRLHLIDSASGRRLFRQSVPDAEFKGYRGPMVFCTSGERRIIVRRDDTISAYDISSGRREYTITKITLPGLVKGFSGGISGYDFKGRSSIMDVLTADGHHVLVNPFNLKIESGVPEKYSDPEAFRLNRPGNNTGSPFLLSPGPRSTLLTSQGSPVDSREVFLDGFILQVAPLGRLVVIASYPDMNKQSLLLSCITREGKKLWQKEEREFTSAESPVIDFSAIYNNDLILFMGGHISSINIGNGRVNWRKRY
jgi:hypothetical protein